MFKKILLMLILMAQSAWANISIFPYSVDFEAKSNKRVTSVRVINTSDKTQTYRVSMVNFSQDKNGKLTEIKQDDGTFADKYINWSPRQFSLKPNEMQTVNIARKSMAQAKDGEFVSHLKIAEVNLGRPKPKTNAKETNTLSMQINALFAVTIPVTIVKGENLVSKTKIENYKLLAGNRLQLELKRLGNKSSRVNVVAVNSVGKEVGRLNGVKIYLSTSSLKVTLPLNIKGNPTNLVLKLEDAKTKEDIFKQDIIL